MGPHPSRVERLASVVLFRVVRWLLNAHARMDTARASLCERTVAVELGGLACPASASSTRQRLVLECEPCKDKIVNECQWWLNRAQAAHPVPPCMYVRACVKAGNGPWWRWPFGGESPLTKEEVTILLIVSPGNPGAIGNVLYGLPIGNVPPRESFPVFHVERGVSIPYFRDFQEGLKVMGWPLGIRTPETVGIQGSSGLHPVGRWHF